MCGILGVVRWGGELNIPALEYGRDLLAHRGPDGAGLWTAAFGDGAARVALAHRRLSILDLSGRGAQPLLAEPSGRIRPAAPLEDEGASLALVFNGEIYNYVELRDELRSLGRAFESHCDTEVLLAAYAQWGDGCVARLNGMFAFAVWDQQRGRLFCARDRFGEKPFYYVFDERAGVFGFASEVKGLIGAGLAEPALDERAVYRYFRFNEQAGAERTIWRGVRRLHPAHTLVLRRSRGGMRLTTSGYWGLADSADARLDEADAADRFAHLFADSVRLRLRSDVPVGTSLSGGLDSSSVVCQISRLGAAAGQKAFTARMADPVLDEGRFADIVLRHTGIPGIGVVPTADGFLDALDHLFYHQEEPFPSPSIFASYLVHRLARDHGVVVMLDGQGADEYLAGYAHYPALVLVDAARRLRLRQWRRERAALRARTGADPVPPRAALYHGVTANVARRGEPLDAPRDVSFVAPDVRAAFADERPRVVPPGRSALKARLCADATLGHLQELLRYADRNSMAFSREVRLPFLDHRLVEFALALPASFLYRDGESKWILRRAMRGTVPQAILERRDKVGFATPWEAWWAGPQGGALRDRLAGAERGLAPLVIPGAAAPGSAAALGLMGLASAQRQLREVAAPARAVG